MNSPKKQDRTEGLFDKMRAGARKMVNLGVRFGQALHKLANDSAEQDITEAMREHPVFVKAMFPKTWFTKKHTIGRVREVGRILAKMTPAQRNVARAHGWIR